MKGRVCTVFVTSIPRTHLFVYISSENNNSHTYHTQLLNADVRLYIHPSKKVMQHDFDQLYFFYPGFLFLKFYIPRKPVYLPFD